MTPNRHHLYRASRAAAGLCTHCANKAFRGRRRCRDCLRSDAAKAVERLRRQRGEGVSP